MTELRPFNRERFLFYMLAGIFLWQAILFTGGVVGCFRTGGLSACPELGSRFENTVNVMIATTLALLTGGAVLGATQKSPSASDLASPSASPPPPRPQLPPESRSSSQEQRDSRQSNLQPPASPGRQGKGSGRKFSRPQDRREE